MTNHWLTEQRRSNVPDEVHQNGEVKDESSEALRLERERVD